jgi:hypothetical protein
MIEETLDKLGYDFRSLSLHSDGRWKAKAGSSSVIPHRLFSASTPEEALNKLLKAINEAN